MLEIKVDLSEFSASMRQNVQLAGQAVREIVRNVAYSLETHAKEQLYPGHGWITGQLHRSISAKPKADGEAWVVKPARDYALFIEEGGGKKGFQGYHYMKLGGEQGRARSQSIAGQTMRQYFGG